MTFTLYVVNYINLGNKFNKLGIQGNNLVEKMIRYSLRRKEKFVIVHATDIMNADKTHRMNVPGIINEVNWTFKLTSLEDFDREISRILN